MNAHQTVAHLVYISHANEQDSNERPYLRDRKMVAQISTQHGCLRATTSGIRTRPPTIRPPEPQIPMGLIVVSFLLFLGTMRQIFKWPGFDLITIDVPELEVAWFNVMHGNHRFIQ